MFYNSNNCISVSQIKLYTFSVGKKIRSPVENRPSTSDKELEGDVYACLGKACACRGKPDVVYITVY